MEQVLSQRFYSRHSKLVAHDLIGKIVNRRIEDGELLKGVIVEAEAYGGYDDPASHAFRGQTPRNEVMFGKGGVAYIYFTYGFHHCFNIVTGKVGVAQAVLIRALEPIQGEDFMRERRGNPKRKEDLTNGPGKTCQALAIDRRLNGTDLTAENSVLFISGNCDGKSEKMRIGSGSRIGINVALEKRWRFYDKNSPYVSFRSKLNLA